MKKLLTGIAVCFCGITQLMAQAPKTDKGAAFTTGLSKAVNDTTQAKGNDRSVWSGYLSGLLNMTGTDGKSSLEFNATLFTITHLGKLAHNDTLYYGADYRKQWFSRNLQLNFGVTPDNKNQLQVDALAYGFKYAVVNNKTINKKKQKKINDAFTTYLIKTGVPVDAIAQKYAVSDIAKFKLIEAYRKANGALPVSFLPPDFVEELKTKFGLKDSKDVDTLLIPSLYLVDLVKNTVKNESTLTFAANSNYDELKSQTDNINLSGEFAFYTGKQGTSQYDLKISYSHAADTSQKHSLLVRTIWDFNFGPDFTFKKIKWFELKPALEYTNTRGPLYKKEYAQAGNVDLTPRFMINKNFWLPVTFKYNAFQKNAHFQGLFSVQYSLK
jgi:hypothetical protein